LPPVVMDDTASDLGGWSISPPPDERRSVPVLDAPAARTARSDSSSGEGSLSSSCGVISRSPTSGK
jgi:hypothetical protein